MATFDPKKLLKQSVESAKKNVSSSGGSRNTTVQQQAQNQSQPKSTNAWNPAEQVKQQIQGGTSQTSSSGQKKTQTQTQTQPKQVQQTVRRATDTIKATVQNAPTVQQQASQQTGETKKQTTQQRTPQQQVQQKAQSAYQSIVTALNAKDAVRNAPVTQQNAIDRGGQKVKQIAQYTVKGSDSKTNKSDEQKSFLRRVKEGINDIFSNAPKTQRTTGYQRTLGGRNIGDVVGDYVTQQRDNRALQFGMSDAEQEAIARARGASEEDIALAKQTYLANVDYINRNGQHGITFDKMVQNQMRTAGGLPMDSWLRFLPDDDGNILDRTMNSARAGILQHGQGFTGLQADIGNRLGANGYEQNRLKDYQYQQLLNQQALSGDNQGMYDRIVSNAVANTLTGLETMAFGELAGLSVGTKPLENVGLANMGVNAFGNAYGQVRTGGKGDQYMNDVDAARRYAYGSALNEIAQEKMFDVLGLVSGGKITENTIPGANVFGLGSFMTEAAEEGAGALADPLTEALLDGEFLSEDYNRRVGEIYAEQGLLGTLQNAGNAALEGGLGGVAGGVMSNPYQAARQVGQDVQTLIDIGDLRKNIKAYERAIQNTPSVSGENSQQNTPLSPAMSAGNFAFAKEVGKFNPNTENVARGVTGDGKNGAWTDNQYETLHSNDANREKTTVAKVSDYIESPNENGMQVDDSDGNALHKRLYEEAKKRIEQRGDKSERAVENEYIKLVTDEYTKRTGIPNEQADAINEMRRILSRGALRASVFKKTAQKANQIVFRDSIKRLNVDVDTATSDDMLSVSNKLGIPVEFMQNDFFGAGEAGLFVRGDRGGTSLRSGVVFLPSNLKELKKQYPSLKNESYASLFLHEATHVMEGSREYFALKEALRLMESMRYEEDGSHFSKQNYFYDKWENEYRNKRTGALISNTSLVNDAEDVRGTERIANLNSSLVNSANMLHILASDNTVLEIAKMFSEEGITDKTKDKARAIVRNSRAIKASRTLTAREQLEYDSHGLNLLQRKIDETPDNAKYVNGFNTGKSESRLTKAEAENIINGYDSRDRTPLNGKMEYETPFAYATDEKGDVRNPGSDFTKYSMGQAKEVSPYSYRQDLQKVGWSDKDIVEISDELYYYNEGEVFDKKAYDHLSEIDNRVKGKDFKTVKRMLDDFDLRETDYDDAEYAEQRENINDRYQDVDGLFREIGVSSSYSDKIAKDLKEKGDYNNYFFTRAVNSLANNKGITKDEARQQLYEIRDEYNKRHPEGLKKAEAKAEYIKRSDEASDNASFKRLMRQEQKEQRNASKSKKNSGKGGWKLAKNGVDLIKTDKDGNIIEIKRRDNKQSKSDQDVFNSVVMGEKTKDQNAKEVKAEEPKVEEVKKETPVEENKREEKKEETPKEETAKAEAPVEPTQQTEEKQEEQPTQEAKPKAETISEETRQDLDTLAYFRNQEIENANLPSGMERVQRKADTERTTNKERVQTKSRISKADTEVASMDAHEMMKYFRQEEWEGSEEYAKKTNEERDAIDDELDILVNEVENPKDIEREEGELHNTLAAILYRAGGKLEHVNKLAKTFEETGKYKGGETRNIERDILDAHKKAGDGKFKDSASAEEFVRRIKTAWKKSTQASQEMSQADFANETGQATMPMTDNTNWTVADGADTFEVSKNEAKGKAESAKTEAKTDSYKKAQEIHTRKTAEAKTEAVSKLAKDVKGKDFNPEQKKTITDANIRAEQIRQEKAERSQAKAEEYVQKKAESQKAPTEEEIRKAGADRLKYAEDFSKSKTSERMVKDNFYDEGLRARIDESHKIKGVKHDKEVMADAKKWRDESGLGGVTAYAEGKNLQNNPTNTEEEEMYLIEGLKDLSRLSSDIRKNIERLEKDGGVDGKEALSQLRDEQKNAMDSAVTVFEAIWNGGSEAGRALRAMRYLYETPELIPTYMQRKVDQLNREYEKKLKGRKITLNQELMDKISDPNISDKERDELWEKVNYDIGDQLPRTLKGRMTQWRKTGMLLNPRTHIRNYASNMLTYGMFGINDTIQAGVENAVLNSKALQKVLNVEYTEADRRSSAGRIGKEYHDVAKWLDEQHEFSKEAPGSGKFNIFEGISEAGAFSNNNAVGKTLNDISRWNNKWLEKEDRTFVQKRARQALAGMLKAQGYTVTKTETGYDITKGTGENAKKIDSKVLEAIEREALKNAQEATYHDFNKAAKAIENLKKSLGPAGYAIDIVMPFTKTPANIMRRSLEFSPAGLAWTLTHDLAKVRSGDMSASTYVTRLSRGMTGTVAFIAGAVLANMGVLSKPDDDDDEARSSYYRENIFGKQDLAVHAGDRYYSIEWAMPTAAPIMMGAAMADEFAKHGLNILDYDIKELLKDGASAINPVLEASYLGSLSDLINSYSQGNAYGGNIMPAGTLGGIDRAASSIIENLAGQMVPTVGGAFNRTIDSTKRTTSGNTMGERMMNKALMNLPFHSNLLQPAIDEKGNEIENVGAVFGNNLLGRAIYNFVMPMTITEDKHDELDSALMDIGKDALPRNQTGSGGLKGQILADLDKAGLSLADISGEEYTEVKKTYYGNYRQYAKDYNELAEYNNLGTHTRDAVYKKIEQLALNEAKATYYDKVGDVNDLYTEEQKAALSLKEYGVSPAEFFLIKDCGLSGNRKALYVMSELERLGVADEVVDDILHQKYFPSAVGLTDSIVVKTPDEREAAREKYLVDDDYETLESKVAAYRAMSKEEYEAKKDKDAEESREDSWEDFFKKYDKKYGTNYSAAFANKDGKDGNSSKGSGKKGKSGGSKRYSSKSKTTKEKAQKQYTPRTYSRRGRSGGGGGGGSSTPDDQALFDMFMKMASSGLSGRSKSTIKASVDMSSDAKLWDTIMNGSKKDVEKLRKELKL